MLATVALKKIADWILKIFLSSTEGRLEAADPTSVELIDTTTQMNGSSMSKEKMMLAAVIDEEELG